MRPPLHANKYLRDLVSSLWRRYYGLV